jgi:hypothetical protein
MLYQSCAVWNSTENFVNLLPTHYAHLLVASLDYNTSHGSNPSLSISFSHLHFSSVNSLLPPLSLLPPFAAGASLSLCLGILLEVVIQVGGFNDQCLGLLLLTLSSLATCYEVS